MSRYNKAFLSLFKKAALVFKYLLKVDSWRSLRSADILLVRHDNNCGYELRGKKYAHLMDSLQDDLLSRGVRCFTVATPFSQYVKDKAYGDVIDLNGAFLRARILGKVKNLICRLFSIKKTIIDAREVAIWRKILRAGSYKYVIAIQPDQNLCKACHELNIWLADLQHGVIAQDHPWYGRRFRQENPPHMLPNCFLCWDKESADVISSWAPDKGIEVKIIGNPWFIRFAFQKPNDPLIKSSSVLYCKDYSKPTILVSLQWGLRDESKFPDQELISGDIMPYALEKLIKQTELKFNWFIRLHPVQMVSGEFEKVKIYLTNTYSTEIFDTSLRVTKAPLPLVLAEIDLHITYFSTVTKECAWFGIPTALLDPQLRAGGIHESYFLKEREWGVAEVLDCKVEDINAWVNRRLYGSSKKRGIDLGERGYYKFLDILEGSIQLPDVNL